AVGRDGEAAGTGGSAWDDELVALRQIELKADCSLFGAWLPVAQHCPCRERAENQRRRNGDPPVVSRSRRRGGGRLLQRPVEIAVQVERALKSLVRIFRQAGPYNPLQRRRQVERRRL